jgi:heme/copper-type cytochrome/quinol oxidase subunit 2
MKLKYRKWAGAILVIVVGTILPNFLISHLIKPKDVYFHIVAQRFFYTPNTIVVNQGDRVHLYLSSKDVTHGFYLEGYDTDAIIRPGITEIQVQHPLISSKYFPAKSIVFTASKSGKFRYRCSITCGYLHPFMMGVMIVKPNSLFYQAIGLMLGILLASFILVWPTSESSERVQL